MKKFENRVCLFASGRASRVKTAVPLRDNVPTTCTVLSLNLCYVRWVFFFV